MPEVCIENYCSNRLACESILEQRAIEVERFVSSSKEATSLQETMHKLGEVGCNLKEEQVEHLVIDIMRGY